MSKLPTAGAILLAITIIACGKSGDNNSGSAPPPEPPAPAMTTTAPAPKQSPANDSVGTVGTTLRGTSGNLTVSCSNITTEFLLTAANGRIRWTAQAFGAEPKNAPPYTGSQAAGVAVEPASGVLDTGKSQLIRIRGTFGGAGKKFWVAVSAPNTTGYSGQYLQFTC